MNPTLAKKILRKRHDYTSQEVSEAATYLASQNIKLRHENARLNHIIKQQEELIREFLNPVGAAAVEAGRRRVSKP